MNWKIFLGNDLYFWLKDYCGVRNISMAAAIRMAVESLRKVM